MTTPAGAVAGNAQAVQRDAALRQPQSGSFWTRKYGPLPGWGWSVLAGGAAIAYLWWRNRSKAAAQSGTTTTGYTGSGYGVQQEIGRYYYGGGGGGGGGTGSGSGSGSGGGGGGGGVKVPNVVGMEVDAAQRSLAAAGLKWSRGKLTPGHGYHVTSESPSAGTSVKTGTTISLGIAQNKK